MPRFLRDTPVPCRRAAELGEGWFCHTGGDREASAGFQPTKYRWREKQSWWRWRRGGRESDVFDKAVSSVVYAESQNLA